jgi:hypothetical protein
MPLGMSDLTGIDSDASALPMSLLSCLHLQPAIVKLPAPPLELQHTDVSRYTVEGRDYRT